MAYTIQSGDTLSGIASKQGTTVANLLSYNPNITDANKIQAGASLNLIAPSQLNPASPAQIPNTPVSSVNPGAVTGMNAQIAANTQAMTQAQLDAQNAAKGITQQNPVADNSLTSLFDKYLGSMSAPATTPMPVQADQSAVNAAKQAQIAAQANLSGVNARITGLTAEAEAAKLAQENTFGTTGNTVGQQAQIDRNYAIKALPLQIEALTAQAQVAQAQGNTALAQDALQQAQSHLDTVYKVQQQDAQNAYDYKTKIATAVYNFASEQQKSQLDALTQKATFEHQDAMATLANERDIAKLKLENSLNNNGIPSSTFILTPEQQADPFIKKLASTAGGKPITDTFAQSLNKGLNVLGQIGGLQTNIKDSNTGPLVGLFRGANPWDTNAQTIKAQLNAIVPNLARGVYGEVGVLTDNDVAQYSKTLPNLKSTEDIRNAVLGITVDLIGKSIKRTLEINAANGKDVSGFIDIYSEMNKTRDSIFSQIPKNNLVEEEAKAAGVVIDNGGGIATWFSNIFK